MKQTNIDLTEAVEAAARRFAVDVTRPAWDDLSATARTNMQKAMEPLITAALPHIERQVREQVAREIEDLEHDRDEMRERLAQGLSATWAAGYDNAVHDAARIARGEQP